MTVQIRMSLSDTWSGWLFSRRDVLANAVTQGVAAATDGCKLELRQAIAAAGHGTRIGNAVGSEVYPKDRPSLGAAGVIFPRGESAERILTAFSEGATIVAKGHPYLSIPTENCPRVARAGRGGGTRAMTPQEVEARFNADLHFVPTRRRGTFVLAIRGVRGRSGRGFRPATARRLSGDRRHAGRAAEMIAMFVLLDRVIIPKTVDADAIAAKWGALVPDLVERALPPQED
jgi:hypothetical protein